jgi:geranylgeranyl transferase type-2 subunit alpha
MPTPKPPKSELLYTNRKIEANFSNFSAWHQRSKVLTILWDGREHLSNKSREDGEQVMWLIFPSASLDLVLLSQEFELVRNAMFTDPNDQSVWMYHRWLVGSGKVKFDLWASARSS